MSFIKFVDFLALKIEISTAISQDFSLMILFKIMKQDFLGGDDFKSQGSHVQYNVGDLSTQVSIIINSY